VNRLNIIPGALTTALFPRFSRVQGADGKQLAIRSLTALMAITTPVAVLGTIALPLFLHYWISANFSERSAVTGTILLAGVWINGLAFVPYTLLQGQNRPDLIAWLHIVEVPFFIGILWIGIRTFGLPGAALAPTLMAGIDAIALFYFSEMLSEVKKLFIPASFMFISIIVAPHALLSIKIYFAVTIIIFSIIWSVLTLPETRISLINMARKLHRSII
jgi:O-antigen/teichoic acid export membrane protein